jgi:hypothetical protein
VKNFVTDKRGIIAEAAVGITLIIVTATLWIISMYPVQVVWDSVNSQVPNQFHGTMTMLNNVCGWVLLIEVGGLLAWIAVHAFRKEILDTPG